MPKVTELYPLPDEEHRALVRVTMESELVIAAAAIVGAFVLTGLATGDWGYALSFGWLADLAQTLTPHWLMFALPAVMICAVILSDRIGLARFPSYRAQKAEVAQGVNGELVRMGIGWIALVSLLAGIFEEALFRYALMGLLALGFGLFFDALPAAILTLLISSVIFTLVHIQYRNPWSIGLAFGLSLLLGAGYLLTGSLLVVAFAHAVYDFAIMIYERCRMASDSDYFGGKVPNDVVRRLLAAQKKR